MVGAVPAPCSPSRCPSQPYLHRVGGLVPHGCSWLAPKQQRRQQRARGAVATRVVSQPPPTADAAVTAAAQADPQGFQEQQLPLTPASIDELPAVEVPPDVLQEFEHRLEEDLQSVAVTLTAVTGVIIFWRGVWSLLDYLLGDSIFGDLCCIMVGLIIVLGIRLSGTKVSSSFWPPS